MVGVSREIRSYVLAAKMILYKQMFGKKSHLGDVKVQKYFKVMENAGSKDLFVWYEMVVWGMREG